MEHWEQCSENKSDRLAGVFQMALPSCSVWYGWEWRSSQPQEVRRSLLPFIFCSFGWHQLLCSLSIYTTLAVQLFHRERRDAPGIGNDKREATIMMKVPFQNLGVLWKWATAERYVLAIHKHQELKSKERIMEDTTLIHLYPLSDINKRARGSSMMWVWVKDWRHPVES